MRALPALRAPLQPPERSMRFAKRITVILVLIGFVVTIVIVLPDEKNPRKRFARSSPHQQQPPPIILNTTYPHTKPRRLADGERVYRIGIVADLDTDSAIKSSDGKAPTKWRSYLKRGDLVVAKNRRSADITWDAQRVELTSSISERGRGMELSDLTFFNGKLLAVDDRTGIVFYIRGFDRRDVDEIAVVPWTILSDGPGGIAKGFKGEWMTAHNRHLYVGGLGKVWTTTRGEVRNAHPQWVKKIGPLGGVRHLNWIDNYNALHSAIGIEHPGYVIHEAACWSDVHRRWFFLPRRASRESYDDQADERRATNLLISCDERFRDVTYRRIGALNPTVGFSSFKFVPGTGDSIIVAVKSEEDRGHIESYVTVFSVDGDILMEPTLIGDRTKYEGIEFL